jgi:hypothetical protein
VFSVSKANVVVCGSHVVEAIDIETNPFFNIVEDYDPSATGMKVYPLYDAFKTTASGFPDNTCPLTSGLICQQTACNTQVKLTEGVQVYGGIND